MFQILPAQYRSLSIYSSQKNPQRLSIRINQPKKPNHRIVTSMKQKVTMDLANISSIIKELKSLNKRLDWRISRRSTLYYAINDNYAP